jgi:hypothetical protein
MKIRRVEINRTDLKIDMKISIKDYCSFNIDLSELKIDSLAEIILNFHGAKTLAKPYDQWNFNVENKLLECFIRLGRHTMDDLTSIEFAYYSVALERDDKIDKLTEE